MDRRWAICELDVTNEAVNTLKTGRFCFWKRLKAVNTLKTGSLSV
jgi:hypothetical protein